MYCTVLYINYLHHTRFQNDSLSTVKSLESVDADYQLNVELNFNPNCILQLILDYLSAEAHMKIDGEHYDLCTMEGDLLRVKDYHATVSGLTIFQPRQTYTVVMIKRNAATSQIEEITPMLNPNSDACEILVNKIKEKNLVKKKSSTSARRSSSTKVGVPGRARGSNTSTVASKSKSKKNSSAAI